MSILDDVLSTVGSNLARAGLGLDPGMRARLEAIEGRTIQIVSTAPSVAVFLLVSDGELNVRATHADKPHTVVTGTGPALAAWLAAPQRIDRVSVSGDETVLMEVAAALAAYSPDLLTPLTNLLGRDSTRTLLGGAELAVSALRSAAEGMGNAIEQSAASRFVTREDTNALIDVLDELRLRIDRLAARVHEREEPGQ